MDFTIRIANTNILIHSVYTGILNTWEKYMVDDSEKPDIEIRTNEEMISDEILFSQIYGKVIQNPKTAEPLLLQRMISELMIERDTLLMHGAVIALDHVSYMFTAKSGTGKTTHIQKWLENKKDSYIVNGDKPFIIINQKGVFACGTPWCGKENLSTNTIVPLRSIVFMERSNKNIMEEVSFTIAFPKLLEQTYHPIDIDKMKKTLALLTKLKRSVSFFRFQFDNFQEDVFSTSFKVLSKQESIENEQ